MRPMLHVHPTARATRAAHLAHAARAIALAGIVALVAAGCRDAPRSAAAGDRASAAAQSSNAGAPAAPDALADATHLVQLVALSDSTQATALADSLAGVGWAVRIEPTVAAGARVFRVQLLLAGGDVLARHVAHALRAGGKDATVFAEPPPGARAPRRALHVVNRGTHGMAARARWALSPDRRGVLAVEDPTAVENDPLPNGFVLAMPGGTVVQRDSVWDVAPSPDWMRLAYARAYVSPPGERDSLTDAEWDRLAARAGIEAAVVRRGAFPTSGMTYAVGVGRPFVLSITAVAAGSTARTRAEGPVSGTDTASQALPLAGAWRLRWSADGSRLAVGAPPRRIADDAGAGSWTLVDPATGATLGATRADSLADVAWVAGPTIDISVPVDDGERNLRVSGGRVIESSEGWIRVRVQGSGGDRPGDRRRTIVGPGVALAATDDGAFIVALAPNPDARSYEATHHLVVYGIPT